MTAFDAKEWSKTSVPGHFRIWKDVYEALDQEARERRITLNTLVNQVLSTYTRDDLLLEEGGFVKVTKSTLRASLALIPDDKLVEFGRLAAQTGSDARMLARSNAINPETILEELRLLSRTGLFTMSETARRGAKIVSLTHDFGPRESVALCSFVESIFSFMDFHPKIKTTSSSVTFEIKATDLESAPSDDRSTEGASTRVLPRGRFGANS